MKYSVVLRSFSAIRSSMLTLWFLLLGSMAISSNASTPSQTCRNTVQGLYYLADSNGQLCRRNQLDSVSGCCKFPELDVCTDCDEASGCCKEFEMCVSCCLKPQNDPTQRAKTTPRGANKPETGYFNNEFDYCRQKCRTNSKSTVHENAYQSSYHHCYGTQSHPEKVDPVVASFSVQKGLQGESCNDACGRLQTRCVAEALPHINSCDKLKQFFPCEDGCANSLGEDQPAYVAPTALRMHRPGTCMVNQRADMMGCAGKHSSTLRLCPCKS